MLSIIKDTLAKGADRIPLQTEGLAISRPISSKMESNLISRIQNKTNNLKHNLNVSLDNIPLIKES